MRSMERGGPEERIGLKSVVEILRRHQSTRTGSRRTAIVQKPKRIASLCGSLALSSRILKYSRIVNALPRNWRALETRIGLKMPGRVHAV
jgi:hypothetical protein